MNFENSSQQLNQPVTIMFVIRVAFVVTFVLSLFIVAKSFVAISNVNQWGDEIRMMFMREQSEAGKRAYPIEAYLQKLDDIQKQWSVMRYVSIGLAVVSGVGIVLAGRTKQLR